MVTGLRVEGEADMVSDREQLMKEVFDLSLHLVKEYYG
jgi:hypothetical protein